MLIAFRFLVAIFVIGVISSLPVRAQDKAVARKFDEFQGTPFGDVRGLHEKTWRFLETLLDSSEGARGVIVVHPEYRPSCDGTPYIEDTSAENLVRQLSAL